MTHFIGHYKRGGEVSTKKRTGRAVKLMVVFKALANMWEDRGWAASANTSSRASAPIGAEKETNPALPHLDSGDSFWPKVGKRTTVLGLRN